MTLARNGQLMTGEGADGSASVGYWAMMELKVTYMLMRRPERLSATDPAPVKNSWMLYKTGCCHTASLHLAVAFRRTFGRDGNPSGQSPPGEGTWTRSTLSFLCIPS